MINMITRHLRDILAWMDKGYRLNVEQERLLGKIVEETKDDARNDG